MRGSKRLYVGEVAVRALDRLRLSVAEGLVALRLEAFAKSF